MVGKRFTTCAVIFALLVLTFAQDVLASNPPTSERPADLLLRRSLQPFDLRRNALDGAFASAERGTEPAMVGVGESSNVSGYKSKGRAFLQSLILPGWGQHYAESKTMMKLFAATEVLLLGTFIGFNVWSNWLEDDFRTFSATHAQVRLQGKPANYFVDIGNFDDIFAYNQAQLRDRDVTDLYAETDEFFWRWDSEANRRDFEDLRIRSDRAANRADFSLAAVFLNHFISAIHSTLAVHKFNQRLSGRELGLQLKLDFDSQTSAMTLNLTRRF